MAKYIKKPVAIEAIEWDGKNENGNLVLDDAYVFVLEASSGEVEIWDVLDLASRHPNPDDMSCLVVTKGN